MLLLEQILVAAARLDHRAHVDVVERRQHGGGVLRVLQALRDRLAKPRHLDPFFLPVPRRRPGPRRRRHDASVEQKASPALGPGLRRGTALLRFRRRDYVVLGQPPVLAGSPDLRRVDMIFEDGAADGRRQGRDVVVFLLRHRRRGIALQRRSLPCAGGVGRRLGRSDRRSRRCRRRRAFVDPGDRRADRDIVAFLDQLLGQHARDRRGHLDADLVGLEAGDRLVLGDRFAGLLEPLGKRAFGDRFPERGDLDVGCHSSLFTPELAGLLWPRAAAIKAACSAAWRLARPLAGEAAAARPAYCGRMPAKPASARHSSRSGSTKNQAPLLRGSSCAQITSFEFGIAWRRLTSGSDGKG